jgi:hypothetical protein
MVDGEDVLLDAVRSRETARLYLPDAPEVTNLRRTSGAALARAAPSASEEPALCDEREFGDG